MAIIAVIDDDLQVCETLASLIIRLGHECHTAGSVAEGLDVLARYAVDLVFLDVRLPDGNGLDVLGRIRKSCAPEVIVLTGQGDPEGAEFALQEGVWEYLVKPSPVRQIRETLTRALAHREEKKLRQKIQLDKDGLIGRSPAIRASCERIAQGSNSDASVLLTGETGTGKELFARTIHRNSLRAEHGFVAVDCASLTESLLESILFGHAKGSFTGAARDSVGLVKLADKGTLFLDEIGELPLSAQKAFLRVLQERRFRPIGSTHEEESDFRLISATNRNLEAMVAAGTFRQDLFYRVNTVQISLPSLRARGEDVLLLAQFHIDRLCDQRGTGEKSMHPDFLDSLRLYSWPGNVRELFNTIEQSFVMAGSESMLYPQHLPQSVRIQVTKSLLRQGGRIQNTDTENPQLAEDFTELPSIKEYRLQMEKQYLLRLKSEYGADVQKMLKISGLSRSHLYAMLKKHALEL